jgi:tetratricopeptide (TPR) repeat protein
MWSLKLKSKSRRIWTLALATWFGVAALIACGPDFPNTLLDGGDGAVLRAPVANFCRELHRMTLATPALEALPATNGFAVQNIEADLADLNIALRKAQTPTSQREEILRRHRVGREKLEEHRQVLGHIRERQESEDETGNQPRRDLTDITVSDGLPGEFADYFAGLIAFQRGENEKARQSWQALLDRPKEQRHFRSVWAAYMLGRSYGDHDPEKAIEHFQRTRRLARQGFADRLGLAAASLGWEARANLKLERFQAAIELYLRQLAAGDESAVLSLRQVASSVLKLDAARLQRIGANSRTRQVITAYVISRFGGQDNDDNVRRWLEAVETAGVGEVESAEQLALAAYQTGEMEIAQRWIDRARNTPVAHWLQAKLLLRAGKVDQAAKLLAKVANLFPIESEETKQAGKLKDSLYVDSHRYSGIGEIDAAHRVLGELGVLRLARREYTEALDALLRSGYWTDAAYVAERVLTANELKGYVERNWPAGPDDDDGEAQIAVDDDEPSDERSARRPVGEEIRYLLARRLVRLSRCHEAHEYFPARWRGKFDELVKALSIGESESLPAEQRAAGFFSAAKIARHDGMELMGTEVEPDWHLYGGDFDEGSIGTQRATNKTARVRASGDELRRITLHRADPEARFHYRYQAAFLGLDAARLLPDNSEETARILCTAGSWLKNRDPQTADLFYKALVRRCRKTALGAEADRKRWFPQIDEQGNLIPASNPAPSTELAPENPNEPIADEAEPAEGAPMTTPISPAGRF